METRPLRRCAGCEGKNVFKTGRRRFQQGVAGEDGFQGRRYIQDTHRQEKTAWYRLSYVWTAKAQNSISFTREQRLSDAGRCTRKLGPLRARQDPAPDDGDKSRDHIPGHKAGGPARDVRDRRSGTHLPDPSRRYPPLVDVIKPNESEARAITGIEIKNTADAKAAIERLKEMGFKLPVVTLGDKGVVAHRRRNRRVPLERGMHRHNGGGDVFQGLSPPRSRRAVRSRDRLSLPTAPEP